MPKTMLGKSFFKKILKYIAKLYVKKWLRKPKTMLWQNFSENFKLMKFAEIQNKDFDSIKRRTNDFSHFSTQFNA